MRILPLLIVLPLAACSFQSDASPPGVAASGTGTTRGYAVTKFSGVSLRGSDDVDVRVGTGFSVRAAGPSAELDKLEIVRVGDTLRVGRKKNTGFGWSGGDHDGVKVFVTMPRIAAAAVVGSGNLMIDRVEGQAFDGDAAGSGNLVIAALRVARAKLSLAGSGDIEARGTVDRLIVDLAGSGNMDGGLRARQATVSLAGSGNIRAEVSGAASVSMVGSGNVDLGKGAHCTTTKIGSGEVTCGS